MNDFLDCIHVILPKLLKGLRDSLLKLFFDFVNNFNFLQNYNGKSQVMMTNQTNNKSVVIQSNKNVHEWLRRPAAFTFF